MANKKVIDLDNEILFIHNTGYPPKTLIHNGTEIPLNRCRRIVLVVQPHEAPILTVEYVSGVSDG